MATRPDKCCFHCREFSNMDNMENSGICTIGILTADHRIVKYDDSCEKWQTWAIWEAKDAD